MSVSQSHLQLCFKGPFTASALRENTHSNTATETTLKWHLHAFRSEFHNDSSFKWLQQHTIAELCVHYAVPGEWQLKGSVGLIKDWMNRQVLLWNWSSPCPLLYKSSSFSLSQNLLLRLSSCSHTHMQKFWVNKDVLFVRFLKEISIFLHHVCNKRYK